LASMAHKPNAVYDIYGNSTAWLGGRKAAWILFWFGKKVRPGPKTTTIYKRHSTGADT